ncbi:hypothetical protein MGLY_19780 [Neomoorella glycerini]|uniref:DUF6431 domain-containing protein n=1 Tax=Neomoorella glycerini TaxID=55779 RepID=A0A6I5ZRG9_9FIRM|nr:hypothetical protein MGLY_19780 [Moorella glycerini]
MQLVYNFGISLEDYAARGKKNEFPVIESCPICMARKALKRHGFYWRNAGSDSEKWLQLPICRFWCRSCRHTFSLLPSFLLPYYQYSLKFILDCLIYFFSKARLLIYYQLLQFYRRRWAKNMNCIQAFFREQGYQEIIPPEFKQRAIKLLEMIAAFPNAETFSQRFHNHFRRNFMAN